MSTDGYTLGISEAALCDAAAHAACKGCRDREQSRQRACAAHAVRQHVCLCVLSSPSILEALEDDFCTRIQRAG